MNRPEEAEHDTGEAPALERVVEALLFATSEPLSVTRLAAILKEYTAAEIRAALKQLGAQYDATGHAFELLEMGGGFRVLTRPCFAQWVRRLQKMASSERLSPAALETLAVIAYKQPVIKAEVDAIRGVKSEGTLQSLLRRHLIRVVGRADVLGRPLLYGTSKLFLDQFGLKNLDELPSPEEAIQKMEAAEIGALGEGTQVTQLDMGEDEARDDGLLTDALPEAARFQKDEALLAQEEGERKLEEAAAATSAGGDSDVDPAAPAGEAAPQSDPPPS